MSKEVSQSQKSLKESLLTLPVENPRAFSKYILPNLLVLWLDALQPHYWMLNTFCKPSVLFPTAWSPGLPTHDYIKEFFYTMSFKSGHNRQGTPSLLLNSKSISGGACSLLHALLVYLDDGEAQEVFRISVESNTTRGNLFSSHI